MQKNGHNHNNSRSNAFIEKCKLLFGPKVVMSTDFVLLYIKISLECARKIIVVDFFLQLFFLIVRYYFYIIYSAFYFLLKIYCCYLFFRYLVF